MPEDNSHQSNVASTTSSHWRVPALAALIACFLALYVYPTRNPSVTVSSCHEPHENVLIGYKILRHTLEQESKLKYLKIMRQATFRAPKGEVSRLMTKISTISGDRKKELDVLWLDESPVIDTSLTPLSDIGDAIQGTAEKLGGNEMVSIQHSQKVFSARFLILQTQATRMVAAMAWSIAERDPSSKRSQWLQDLATEYESLRDELVAAIIAGR